EHLAHRGSGGVLAAVQLSLGEGPVVVLRTVHQQHVVTVLAPHHGTRGEDVGPVRHAASLTPPVPRSPRCPLRASPGASRCSPHSCCWWSPSARWWGTSCC